MKCRKKPVVIDAIKWDGDNVKEVMDFMTWRNASHDNRTGLLIHTLEGTLHASIGDMIIKGVQGEFYACKPDIFAATYEDAIASPSPPLLPQQGGEQTDRMPECPKPFHTEASTFGWPDLFTAAQMRDYGLKCRRATLTAVLPQVGEENPSNGELLKLLPVTNHYLDEPDGGSPSLLTQLQRMAADAKKYRDGLGEAKAVAPIGYMDPNSIEFLRNRHLIFATIHRDQSEERTCAVYAAPVAQALPVAEEFYIKRVESPVDEWRIEHKPSGDVVHVSASIEPFENMLTYFAQAFSQGE